MLSERLIAALNEQVGREYAAAHQYSAIAAYYDAETFPRLARFFYKQAGEERAHATRIANYLLETGAPLRLGGVPAPQAAFDDHIEPIQAALQQQRKNTVDIGGIFDTARETRDFASEVFLQWFVEEQIEEEAAMESLLQVAERVRDFPMMLEEFIARDGKRLGAARGPASR